MEDWEKELEEKFGDEPKTDAPLPAPPPNRETKDGDPHPKPEEPDIVVRREDDLPDPVIQSDGMSLTFKLFVIAILLTILVGSVYWAIKKKSAGQVVNPKPAPTLPVKPPVVSPPVVDTSRVAKLETEVKELKTSQAKITTEMEKNWKKIQVLGIVVNENATIQKYKYDPSHTIYLTKNWGLSNTPRYLKMTPKDLEFIKGLKTSLTTESMSEPAAAPQQQPEVPDAANSDFLKLRKDVDILAENNYHLYRKVRLMGIITNENAWAVKQYLPNARLVTITQDWGLSQPPQHLKLTEDDMDFLGKND